MTDRTATTKDCFKQGVEARAQGRKLADNPYGLRTEHYEEWAAGWRATFDLDEDDDPDSTRTKPTESDETL